MSETLRTICGCCVALILCSAAIADDAPAPRWPPPRPDTFVARLEALAVLESLNAELLSHDSATLTLGHWCETHRLASPATIVAEREDIEKPPSPEQRQELAVSATEPVRYRRVRLRCGSLVLSEADNWYVPGRLTPEMNRLLETTNTPFGLVVRSLHFQRHTLNARLLWSPLPDGWEMDAGAAEDGASALVLPPDVLQHRAVLNLANGTPFSEVVETYTRNVLAFGQPQSLGAPQDGPPAAPLDRRQLVGAWRLVAIDYRGPQGPTDPFYQAGSSGLIVYDADGWMTVEISAPDRQGAPVPERRVPRATGRRRDKASAFDTYYAYFGTWDFDAATSTVTHQVRGALIPAEVGMRYVQTATIEDGRLVLTNRSGDPGRETLRRKVWERASP